MTLIRTSNRVSRVRLVHVLEDQTVPSWCCLCEGGQELGWSLIPRDFYQGCENSLFSSLSPVCPTLQAIPLPALVGGVCGNLADGHMTSSPHSMSCSADLGSLQHRPPSLWDHCWGQKFHLILQCL